METASGYRLYDVEVIEVSPNVSLLVLLPPVEQVCIAPGTSNQLAERKDLVLLPVQVFETSEYWILVPLKLLLYGCVVCFVCFDHVSCHLRI